MSVVPSDFTWAPILPSYAQVMPSNSGGGLFFALGLKMCNDVIFTTVFILSANIIIIIIIIITYDYVLYGSKNFIIYRGIPTFFCQL